MGRSGSGYWRLMLQVVVDTSRLIGSLVSTKLKQTWKRDRESEREGETRTATHVQTAHTTGDIHGEVTGLNLEVSKSKVDVEEVDCMMA